MNTLIFLSFVHFLADFPAQTSWMAQNKSKSWKALGAHVGTYSLVLFAALLPYIYFLMDPSDLRLNPFGCVLHIVGINAIVHFIIDAVTSRINSFCMKTGRISLFWTTIGFDQFLHQATLIWLAKTFLGVFA